MSIDLTKEGGREGRMRGERGGREGKDGGREGHTFAWCSWRMR